MSDAKRMDVRLHGRVQGVGFRWWCARTANGLGVIGDVRNRDDGTVEVRAEAVSDVLERFRERLSEGPPMARVDEIEECEAVEAELPVASFDIVR